jgi:hypothetical protein
MADLGMGDRLLRVWGRIDGSKSLLSQTRNSELGSEYGEQIDSRYWCQGKGKILACRLLHNVGFSETIAL